MATPKNLFYSDKERALFESINQELLGDILQQQIYYYSISNKYTKANIYGESETKVFKQPIKFWALVEYSRPESSYETDQVERDYNIRVKFLRKYLADANCEAKEGDFIQFGNVLYEIYKVDEAKLIIGQITEMFDTIIECKSTRLSVTDIKIEE